MRTASLLLVLVVALSCGSLPTEPDPGEGLGSTANAGQRSLAPTVVNFAELAVGDSIVMRLELNGCFHHSVHRVVFRMEGGRAALSLATIEGNAMPGYAYAVPEHLARADLERLDEALHYYRTATERGMCTSSTTVALTLYRGGAQTASEDLYDSSCPGLDNEHLLDVGTLVKLAKRPVQAIRLTSAEAAERRY